MSFQKFMEQHMQLHRVVIELKTGRHLVYQVDSYRKEELETWMRNPMDSFESLTSSFLSFYSDYDRIAFVRISAINRLIFCWDIAATVVDPTAYSDPFNILQPLNIGEGEIITTEDDNKVPEWLEGLGLEEHFGVKKEGEASNDIFDEVSPGAKDKELHDLLELLNAEEAAKANEGDGSDTTELDIDANKTSNIPYPALLDELDWDTFTAQPGDRDSTLPFDNMEQTGGPDIPDAIVLLSTLHEPYLYYDLSEEVDPIPVSIENGFSSMAIECRFLSFSDADGENNYIPLENVVCLDVTRRLVFDDQVWDEMERSRRLDENLN